MPGPQSSVRFPRRRGMRPHTAIGLRFGIVLALILLTWGLVVLERGSYTDTVDGKVSVTDALYYTAVTLTTTGYGDITPATTGARLVNALVISPFRLLFVVLLIGTTLKALTMRTRDEYRLSRWRSRVNDHIVLLGYGTKGRNAVRALRREEGANSEIVVVDDDAAAVRAATDAGLTVVHGSASTPSVLTQALIERARLVIVALGRDDATILATLTVRRLAPNAVIVASAREEHQADLLRANGVTSVIVSSETTGRLLGLAAQSPNIIDVVSDLISFGAGIDLDERSVTQGEVGRRVSELAIPVLAVIRNGQLMRYTDPRVGQLAGDDRLIFAAAR